MNDDTTKNTGFGGNANSFNNNGTNGTAFPRPNNSNVPSNSSIKPEPKLNPQFSGMPASQSQPKPQAEPQSQQFSRPPQPQSYPQTQPQQAPKPQFTPSPSPAPAPVPLVVAPKPYTPPPAMSASMPSSTAASQQAGNSFMKAQQVSQSKSSGSNKGLIGIIVSAIVVVLVAAAIWYFVPADMFNGNKDAGTIEDKVANPDNQPAANQNSMFPTGVVNTSPSVPTQPVTKTSNTYSMSDQDKVTAYIRANINKIAKTTGYVVTDVTFDGPSRAIVTYSRGNTVRSAIVNTSIDSSGNVKVTGFTPLTK